MTNAEKDHELIKYMEDNAQEMARDANDIIVEILESYMGFCDIIDKVPMNKDGIDIVKMVAANIKSNWQPILDAVRAKYEEVK